MWIKTIINNRGRLDLIYIMYFNERIHNTDTIWDLNVF